MGFDRVIPHSDGAGIVEAVGSAGLGIGIGERVFIRNGQWRRWQGSAAEYIALDAGLVHPLPDAVSFEVGASLGIPALTAAHAVLGDGPVAGASLLVQGGGGTVARLAVQIAHASGARVITTSSRADQRRRLIGLGASAALDYRDPELAHQIIAANGGRPIDRVIDAEVGANLDTSLEVLREGGVIAGYGSVKHPNPELPFLKMMFKNITLSSILVYLLKDDDAARYAAILGQMLTAGTVQLSVAAALGLEEAALAHEMVEAGNRDGAVVLTV
jgi:NADPH2:quinone reductase